MVQGYYTLEEAAKILELPPDKLSQMAQKREVRAFADRGTWRFRTQDIEELARRMGRGSNPDLQLAEPLPPKKKTSGLLRRTAVNPPGTPGAPAPSAPAEEPSIFDFDKGGEKVDLGEDIVVDSPSASR